MMILNAGSNICAICPAVTAPGVVPRIVVGKVAIRTSVFNFAAISPAN